MAERDQICDVVMEGHNPKQRCGSVRDVVENGVDNVVENAEHAEL